MTQRYLINANIHRVKEGARVLEDIARFILRDEPLFKRIRDFRHSLLSTAPIVSDQKDLGGPGLPEKNLRQDLMHIVQANALRMQEALRVLEETAQDQPHKQQIKSLRYTAYALHADIYRATEIFLKREKLQGLYLVIDSSQIDKTLEEIIEVVNQTHVNIVQLRNKHLSTRDFFCEAKLIKDRLSEEKLLIVNDHLDVAIDLAAGVHLGQQDYPLERVRNLVPADFVVGVSCHNVLEAKKAEQLGATYLAVGCLFPTESKKEVISTSLEELKKIKQRASIPVCAIGGINADNASKVADCAVEMIGMISAVWKAPNPVSFINHIIKKFPVSVSSDNVTH